MALAAGLACPACSVSDFGGNEPRGDGSDIPTLVDEKRGEYGGITLGASADEIRDRFGEPGGGEGFFPLQGEGFTGPVSIPTPGGRPTVLRYDYAAFLVAREGGLVSLVVTAPGASTQAGVAAGDSLGAVQGAYDGVHCGEQIAGEAIVGEDPTYRWCSARVGHVEVFFGGDPIESITLTRRTP